jgi:hypothetical protein
VSAGQKEGYLIRHQTQTGEASRPTAPLSAAALFCDDKDWARPLDEIAVAEAWEWLDVCMAAQLSDMVVSAVLCHAFLLACLLPACLPACSQSVHVLLVCDM